MSRVVGNETQRWAAAALPFGDGKQYLHKVIAYAEPGASADDRLLVRRSFFAEAASLREQPVVLSLDANLSGERSDTLNALFTPGRWTHLPYEVAADRDQLQATYHKDVVARRSLAHTY